ncbi:hypothetical protein [Halostella litorea]|uniref:hypothetical protein n=1 Tax=Halostella litorea TaxID=2528831 RepID=UPI0010923640|nr:hypothetical protein [Halostella litorea]
MTAREPKPSRGQETSGTASKLQPDGGCDWEQTARRAVEELLWEDKDRLILAIKRLEKFGPVSGDGDDVSAEDVNEFRSALIDLEATVEESIVPHIEGVSRYERIGERLGWGGLADVQDVEFKEFVAACVEEENAE